MNSISKQLCLLLTMLLATVLILPGCGIVEKHFPGLSKPPTTSTVATSTSNSSSSDLPEALNWVPGIEQAELSVVAIETDTGAASGWIFDSNGIIVTNHHVIEGANEVGVILYDGSYYPAENIYSDPVTDIAVIMIDASGLRQASIGASSSLSIGQPVAVIGNALGHGISMKGGWVSRLDVSSIIDGTALYGLIETDAAMNPGNSGGPLINLMGEVVGIANSKLVDVVVEGVAYAISIDSALPVIQQLVEEGSIAYPFLGVQGFLTVNQSVARFYELQVEEGVLIFGVVPGSGADKAGLAAGDVILSIDGKPVPTIEDLVEAIRSKQAGQTIDITYDREGNRQQTSATLTEPING